ncbi:MAG TPA: BREX system ATP-binding domain-containing protein, partial [Thermomicrobiales bacterium]|nr:BREX system ATP-binding domain-containing protein [Thermomicrobiales bacterium]
MTQSQVFISYQRADEPFARQVREYLAANGVRTWMDQYDIPVGAYWPDEIDKALAASDIVVGVLSPDSVESRNVKNEWDWAILNEKPLLMLQYRPCSIPHRYVSINFIDASRPDTDAAFVALLDTIGGSSPAANGQTAPSPAAAGRARHGSRSGAPVRRRQEPFVVGREREQALLRARLDDLAAGRGSLILLAGEAGIGKTTLTNWLAWAAEQQGALVASGGCYDLTMTPPYGPWARMTGDWPDDPALPPMPSELREGTGMGAIRNQTEFIALFERFLSDASVAWPLLLLLEDFHWADEASLDLLRSLARSISRMRVVLVVTYRDDELTRRHPLAQMLPALAREDGAVRITLSRLALPATRNLVTGRYQFSKADTTRLGAYVHRLSEGNPFFCGEILRELEEVGALSRAGDHWQITNLDRVRVPALVRQVIERRLERLDDDARSLLQIAAVIGQEVPVDLWVEVSGASDEHLAETLERATEARLVVELRGGTAFSFTHALIRETLYESLVSLRRRRWHRTTAEVLERMSRPDPDAIAHHYQQANDDRAFEWLIRAGRRAMERYSWRTAVERWEAAAELLEGDDARRREFGWLLFLMGTHLRYASRERALDYLRDAQWIGHEIEDQLLRVCASAGIGFQRLFSGRIEGGLEDLVRSIADYDSLDPALIETVPDIVNRDSLLSLMENRRQMQVPGLVTFGHQLDALRLSDELLARPRTYPNNAAMTSMGNVYLGRGLALASMARPDEAADAFARAREEFETTSETNPYVFGIGAFFALHTVELPYHADQIERLEAVAHVGIDAWVSARESATEGRSTRVAMLGMLLIHGDWDEAREIAEIGVAGEVIMVLWDEMVRVLGLLNRHQGRPDQAWEQVARYFPDGPTASPSPTYVPTATALQRLAVALALDAGDVPLAHDWLVAHDAWLDWSDSVAGHADGTLIW